MNYPKMPASPMDEASLVWVIDAWRRRIYQNKDEDNEPWYGDDYPEREQRRFDFCTLLHWKGELRELRGKS